MRGSAALLSLAVLLLSGCSGGEDRRASVDPDVGSDDGAVRVIVVDQAGRVEGATVLLQKSGRLGTTDANGILVERGIRPGLNETAVVNAARHYEGRETFTVKAGEVTEVVVFVDRRTNGS